MATTMAPEDIQQLWLDFKADLSTQDLRNRLIEQYLPLGELQRRTDLGETSEESNSTTWSPPASSA